MNRKLLLDVLQTPYTAREISEKFNVSQPHARATMNALVDLGLVEKKWDPIGRVYWYQTKQLPKRSLWERIKNFFTGR